MPNTYVVEDEGKVVSNGALVAQTARLSSITQNGTYDTTENNSVTVNVSGGGGLPNDVLIGTSAPTSADGSNGDNYWQYAELGDTVRTGSANAGFDSDYIYAPSDTVEIRFMLNQVSEDYIYIWSCIYSSGSNPWRGFSGILFNPGETGKLECYWSAKQTGAYQTYTYSRLTQANCLNTPVVLRFEGRQVYLNGTLIKTFSGTPSGSFEVPLCFFALHRGSSYQYPATYVSLEYCKIWDSNGNLVRHYLPYDNNGTAKLRDSVTQSVCGPSNTSALSLEPAKKIVEAQYVKSGGIWLPL